MRRSKRVGYARMHNNMNAAKIKKTKKKTPLSRFLSIIGIVVGTFTVVASAAAIGYVRSTWEKAAPYWEHLAFLEAQAAEQLPDASDHEASGDAQEDDSGFMLPPRKTNVLLIGMDDEGGLSDVMMLASFDRETGKFDMISLPRDTYTTLSRDAVREMQQAGRRPPASGIMKLNAVRSYGGAELGPKVLRDHLESLLGISINYFVEIDLRAFVAIVDALGGVEMEIRPQGLYYSDPYQNLRISIPGGMQVLDGKMAEGVVRYRNTYRGGDLQRIEVQQAFLRALFSQVLDRDEIVGNAMAVMSVIINYVKTDFSLADAPKYLRYVGSLRADHFETHMLPGHARTISGASYYVLDDAAVQEMVKEIFYSHLGGEDAALAVESDDEYDAAS